MIRLGWLKRVVDGRGCPDSSDGRVFDRADGRATIRPDLADAVGTTAPATGGIRRRASKGSEVRTETRGIRRMRAVRK